jgi:hypothetical protein
MPWPPISLNEDKGLAHYALDQIALGFPIAVARQDVLAQPDGLRRVTEAIYNALSERKVAYALEPYSADARLQQIRAPETVLGGAGEGTCLDLALLFAGIALGKELAPLVVMLDGHALVAVSLDDDRRSASDMPRENREGAWLDEGVLRDGEVLRNLIDAGHYLAIECTGFAQSGVLPPGVPESAERVGGKLTFEAAVSAGRNQLDFGPRPFRFAIDLAALRDRHGFAAYDSPLAAPRSPFHLRLERLFDDERLFGGRDDELGWLDQAIGTEAGGYAFVTGLSGSGKTALLVSWVRALLRRPPVPGRALRIVYTFISQKHELADEQPTLELLCEQLLRARHRSEPLPTTVPTLQATYVELLTKSVAAGEEIVVVIDGLDEAKGWTPTRLMFPRVLPERVHVIFSARDIAHHDWVSALDIGPEPTPTLSLVPLAPSAVAALLRNVPMPLAGKADDDLFVRELHRVSAGDPFYLKFLIEDLLKLAAPAVSDVRAKPSKIADYLDAWWEDATAQGEAKESVGDLLGYLVVALGALRRDELIDIAEGDALRSTTIGGAIAAVKRYVIGNDEAGYTLCHPRFHEYLVSGHMRPNEQRPYRAALIKWCESAWSDDESRYPAAHVIAHLAGQRKLARLPERAGFTAKMLAIVMDPGFRERKLATPESLIEYEQSFREVLGAAVADPWPIAMTHTVKAALGLADLRLSAAGVPQLFEAAREGAPETGVQPLSFTAPDHDWFRACLLVSTWLCTVSDKAKAGQFRTAQQEAIQPDALWGTLKLLDERTVAAIEGKAEPALALPFHPGVVPEGVSAETARAIVVRIGGAGDNETIAAQLNPSMIRMLADRADFGDETPTYIAEGDSPWLVGYAIDEPAEGESLIRCYIAVHAENPYPVYRNRSLWAVLGAVLCLPSPLARDLARTICEAALNPVAVEYREMLRLAGIAVAAKGGNAADEERLQAHIDEARSRAAELNPIRSEADTWGHHCRRFAALAETVALTCDNRPLVDSLLDEALRFPFGYAGYQAPASLALADANFIGRPHDRGSASAALAAAQRAAHNVQESRFCAFTTARVNAIRRRWRPGSIPDLASRIERFVDDPFDAEFSPVHIVGERYCGRSDGPNMLALPPGSLAARSLEEIAAEVYGVPLARLETINPGIDPRLALSLGTAPDDIQVEIPGDPADGQDGYVNVPDPGFAAILAARFAAEILGRRAEPHHRAAELIAKLVPIAAANATALDLVLARMLLASQPLESSAVERIRELAPDEWMKSPMPNRNVEA